MRLEWSTPQSACQAGILVRVKSGRIIVHEDIGVMIGPTGHYYSATESADMKARGDFVNQFSKIPSWFQQIILSQSQKPPDDLSNTGAKGPKERKGGSSRSFGFSKRLISLYILTLHLLNIFAGLRGWLRRAELNWLAHLYNSGVFSTHGLLDRRCFIVVI